jgi:hypothetical protein
MASGIQSPSWSEKVLESFRDSPKKAAVLGGLCVMLVALWLKMFVGGKTPSSALAAPAQTQEVRVVDDLDAPVTARKWAGEAGESASLMQWARQPVEPIKRNLFAVPLDYYPRDGAGAGEDTGNANGFWDQLSKSMSAQADQQEQRQILIENIKIKAAALNLQSTMMGAQPTAMVNGEMVREESVVAGFRVLRIEARRMIIEREGIKLEIFMK